MFVTRNKVDLMYVVCVSITRLINFYGRFTIYREVDEDEGGSGGDEEEFEDGEQLPPESDTDESEDDD